MKLTKNNVKMLLQEENYIDALAYVCNRLMKFKTADGQENELDRIDEIMFKYAEQLEYEDKRDEAPEYILQATRIITGCRYAIGW